MTECPVTPSTTDRLAQPYRPNPFVRSEPARRTTTAIRVKSNANALLEYMKTAVFNPQNNASTAVTGRTDNALSP